MTKSVKTTQPVVAYLKVSGYIKRFLQTKYGEIVKFPFVSMLYSAMFQHIVDNPLMAPVTPFSFSQRAFCYEREDVVFDMNISLPPEDEKDQFVAIELPPAVFRFGREMDVTPFCQFSRRGAVEMRRLIHREFWTECLAFIDDCFTRSRICNVKVTRENALIDFMFVNGINMVWHETLIRHVTRVRRKIEFEIEQKRAAMEENANCQFCYT